MGDESEKATAKMMLVKQRFAVPKESELVELKRRKYDDQTDVPQEVPSGENKKVEPKPVGQFSLQMSDALPKN